MPLINATLRLSLKVLSVGELLSKAIKYIHSEQSVSSLFEQ